MSGNAEVYDEANVYGMSNIYGNARIYGYAVVHGNANINNNAKVYHYADVYGNVQIGGDAKIQSIRDYLVFKNCWSSGRYFTWTRSNNMWQVGCFYGTGEELIAKAYKDSEKSGREYERVVHYVNEMINEDNETELQMETHQEHIEIIECKS